MGNPNADPKLSQPKLKSGQIIPFLRSKEYKFIKELGRGGLGKTILVKDEQINEDFVCKKYAPYFDDFKEKYYPNFIEEIKLLHLVFNKNIVRVFNYYLYPRETTGFILMEYVNGETIDNYLKSNPEKLSEVFKQVIAGFKHLQELKILHRDIRPQNILVSNDGVVKIIDFGFGKKIEFDGEFNNSVSKSWRYEPKPDEFEKEIYDFRTEVYFIGKLFEEIIEDLDIKNFQYSKILKKMIQTDYQKRQKSFFEIERGITAENQDEIKFSPSEKTSYRIFANSFSSIIAHIALDANFVTDTDQIKKSLKELITESMLEEYLTNNEKLIRVFIKGQCGFYPKVKVELEYAEDFLRLLNLVSKEKEKIIFNNFWNRLELERKDPEENRYDDLPF